MTRWGELTRLELAATVALAGRGQRTLDAQCDDAHDYGDVVDDVQKVNRTAA